LDPVEQVEGAVGAQEDDVERGYDRRDRGLAQEEELREDGDGFEDLGEDPEVLRELALEGSDVRKEKGQRRRTHLAETPAYGIQKDHHNEGRQDCNADQNHGAQLPGDLALAGAWVDVTHDGDGVEGREQVEDLEEVIPFVGFFEEVCVAGDEDERVEELCEEGDTCGATHVSIRSQASNRRTAGSSPSELLLRWMENMRMHFDVMWDKSAAILKA
jgi:hypothetical protein